MQWLLFGGILGLLPRVLGWIAVWHLVGTDWHWFPHAVASWLLGDLAASLVLKVFGYRGPGT